MPPRRLITLENAPHILICPLPVLTNVNNNLVLRFALSEHQGSETRYICCAQRAPLLPAPRPILPLLLELVGQISITDCYLTSHGYKDTANPGSNTIATCWMEARPDVVSEIYWRQILPTIQTLRADIPGEVDISKLVALASDGSVRVRVSWEPDAGETIAQSLPMFDEFEDRQVPASISDVPFGLAVRAVFSLEYTYDSNSLMPAVMYARLARIARV